MIRDRLLVLANPDGLRAIDAALDQSGDRFTLERVNRCSDALRCLAAAQGGPFSAVVVDLYLPDSHGLPTLEALLRQAHHLPILVVTARGDEPVARQAVQFGAQDYLLLDHLDGYSLPKALDSMLGRAARLANLLGSAASARVTLDSIGDAVVSTDASGNVTYLNPVAERMTGWSGPEALGKRLHEVVRIIDAHSREPVRDPLALAMRLDHTVGLGPDCLLVRRDGRESAIEDTAAPIHDSHGTVTGAVIVFHDVGAARAMSARMSRLAQHDPLTELPNRLLLNDRICQAIAAARRRDRSLAVLFIDIDRFKCVNDMLGHATGDAVLQSIARRLVASVRDSDTVSRLGGDEFVVLLSEVACGEDAAFSADKLLAATAAAHRVDDQDLFVTASAGIAVYPADGMDAETLVRNADLAMLRAKPHRRGLPPFAMAAATASHVASKDWRVKPAPEGNQFPELPPASV